VEINFSALLGQILLGLVNGAFYAVLCLGLSIIFGMLFVINFAHGAQYMMGGFAAWILLNRFGVGYWYALFLAPLIVGFTGILIERLFLRYAYKLDHIFSLLLTVGLAIVIEGLFFNEFGSSGKSYPPPESLAGGFDLGFMYFPKYRAFVVVASVVVCAVSWFLIERTALGSYLRAATEDAQLVRAFGINVPVLFTATYAFSVGLAAFAGVLSAPIIQVSPFMGGRLMDAAFAVVVIGGMGSLKGAIYTGFGVGFLEGLTKYFYPEASSVVVFLLMALVLVVRPMGLFGKTIVFHPQLAETAKISLKEKLGISPSHLAGFLILVGLIAIAPALVYSVTVMHVLTFALFAASLNLTFGFGGLLCFGHAMFFGMGSYVMAHSIKVWGVTPEVGILLGTLAGAAVGLVVGLLAIKRKAIYFSMITLAFSQLVYFLCVQMPFTGGEDGIQAVPRGMLFGLIDLGDSTNLYIFIASAVLLGLVAIYRVVHSPFGHILRSIRDNESRAISLGYDTERLRLIAFVLAALFAGLAGSLKVLIFQIASLTDVSAGTSGDALFMTLLGGIGTIFGPIAGAAVLVGMQHYFASLGTWVQVLQGLIFVACVMLFRQGIIGQLSKMLGKPL
jgi:branched-chain amino acid transport system permease protein